MRVHNDRAHTTQNKRGDLQLKPCFDRRASGLRKDQAEKNNLIETHPKIAVKLEQQLRAWQQSVLDSLTGANYR